MEDIAQWLAPIVSALLVLAGQAVISVGQRRLDAKMDERHRETEDKRAADAEWRAKVDGILTEQERAVKAVALDKDEWQEWRRQLLARLDQQDRRIFAVLKGQTTQMRSDLVHKAHRYVDDLGCASTEEKDAFHQEYDDYCAIRDQYGIENSFVDKLAQQVMDLPGRDTDRE